MKTISDFSDEEKKRINERINSLKSEEDLTELATKFNVSKFTLVEIKTDQILDLLNVKP
jgi:hypothetical protein